MQVIQICGHTWPDEISFPVASLSRPQMPDGGGLLLPGAHSGHRQPLMSLSLAGLPSPQLMDSMAPLQGGILSLPLPDSLPRGAAGADMAAAALQHAGLGDGKVKRGVSAGTLDGSPLNVCGLLEVANLNEIQRLVAPVSDFLATEAEQGTEIPFTSSHCEREVTSTPSSYQRRPRCFCRPLPRPLPAAPWAASAPKTRSALSSQKSARSRRWWSDSSPGWGSPILR